LALKAALAEIDARKQQYETLQNYTTQIEAQRDKAYKAAEPGWGLPFWVWATFGAAAATVFIRGVK
jgi:hypothetical protein